MWVFVCFMFSSCVKHFESLKGLNKFLFFKLLLLKEGCQILIGEGKEMVSTSGCKFGN